MTDAIVVEQLAKTFKTTRALDGLDLSVPHGAILGVLGPNGAGKTTAVRILTTLLRPDYGAAWVTGLDVLREPQRVRARIGLTGQSTAVDDYLTGRENLELVGRLYHLYAGEARARTADLLDRVDLVDAADRTVKTYSGGMRRRLDVAASLIARPRVLFLDEPTTGLDPLSRALIWDRIRELRERFGATIFLTTQYLEEADELADRVAIIDHGRIVRQGTPEALKAEVGADVIDVAIDERETGAARVAIEEMQASGELPGGELRGTEAGYTLFIPDGPQNIAVLIRGLDKAGVRFGAVSVSRPTLDDVFLAATGGRMAAAAERTAAEEERTPEPAGRSTS